jgi:hypothetical protein
MKILCLILFLPARLFSQVVFSEILYNEPGSLTAEEWVEIYNGADRAVDLSNILFVSGSDTTLFLQGAVVPSMSYAVLARRLTSTDGAPSFEAHWGDSSGYWRDYPSENYPAFNARMDLPNSSGAVYLLRVNGDIIDECAWSASAGDGQSLERDELEPPSGSWHLSTDTLGSTPGRANSPKESQMETGALNLSTRLISQLKGELLRIDYSVPTGSTMTLEVFDDSGHRQITLGEQISGQGQVTWNGRAGDSKRLPPGIYMLLSTISGLKNKSTCIPIVIAP